MVKLQIILTGGGYFIPFLFSMGGRNFAHAYSRVLGPWRDVQFRVAPGGSNATLSWYCRLGPARDWAVLFSLRRTGFSFPD